MAGAAKKHSIYAWFLELMAPYTYQKKIHKVMDMKNKREALLNLVVTALNECINRGKINLDVSSSENDQKKNEYLLCEIGGKPTVINWCDVGFDELRFSVWWDYDHSKHPQQKDERFQSGRPVAKREKLKDFLGTCVSCWLERKTGKYIMGKDGNRLFEVYVRQSNLEHLLNLPKVEPDGFKDSGKFYL
ncbi:hypothetical protein DZ685_13975 [Salmonella enterica]|nr:hypothetical protein [Salmonella enterica]EAR5326192.1 hypothetical protein [Salmonella enterica]EBI3595063.1 hypothetical protein [Salmonella enterica]ECX7813596.1 hypothetical protein [Salmonella enterica]MGX83519.1 hypothetical protein [Salmonella enterica]